MAQEKLVKKTKMIDTSVCKGKQEVVITLDELHRAYRMGYENGLNKDPTESAPVEVTVYNYEVDDAVSNTSGKLL